MQEIPGGFLAQVNFLKNCASARNNWGGREEAIPVFQKKKRGKGAGRLLQVLSSAQNGEGLGGHCVHESGL